MDAAICANYQMIFTNAHKPQAHTHPLIFVVSLFDSIIVHLYQFSWTNFIAVILNWVLAEMSLQIISFKWIHMGLRELGEIVRWNENSKTKLRKHQSKIRLKKAFKSHHHVDRMWALIISSG